MIQQPLDSLMTQLGITNAEVVKASTEQLSFKMLQKGRQGERLSPKIQDKILSALLTVKPTLKIRRRDLFRYEPSEGVVEQIKSALSLTREKKIKYAQFVDLLGAAGINRYAVAVAVNRATFYGPGGEAHIEEGSAVSSAAPGMFDRAAIQSAVADIQKERIDYPAFLKRIHAAGIVGYEVNIRDRQIRYKGNLESYKEQIPLAGAEPEITVPKVEIKKLETAIKSKKTKNTGIARIKKTGKFVVKHRTKKRR